MVVAVVRILPKNTNVRWDSVPMNEWGKDHCNAIGDGYGWIG
jgi:hypothetical protein